jgi:hypothetical protein
MDTIQGIKVGLEPDEGPTPPVVVEILPLVGPATWVVPSRLPCRLSSPVRAERRRGWYGEGDFR